MQIHELNNFTGTLGSGAYLAIDDGTDTGKISSQGLLAATEARIDNIIAGPAPSAEEIVDARLGADGVTYPSLGDAIRDQVGDLKSALVDAETLLSDVNSRLNHYYPTFTLGALDINRGNESPATNRMRTDFLPTQNVKVLVSLQYRVYVIYYNEYKQWAGNSGGWKIGVVDINSAYPFFRLLISHNSISDFTGYTNKTVVRIDSTLSCAQEEINEIYAMNGGYYFDIVAAALDISNGNITPITLNRASSELISGEYRYISLASGYSCYLIYYNNDLSYAGNSGAWLTGENEIGECAFFRVMIKNDSISDFTDIDNTFAFLTTDKRIIQREFTIGQNDNVAEVLENAMQYEDSIVYIEPYEHDCLQEWKDYYGTDYFDNLSSGKGLILKNNVRIVGASGCKLKLHYTGSNDYVMSDFSLFNNNGGESGYTIENVIFETSKIRYTIHDERSSDSKPYKTRYSRCRFVHDNSASTWQNSRACIGGGLGLHGDVVVEDCIFSTVTSSANMDSLAYHNSAGAGAQNSLVIKNNYCEGDSTLQIACYGASTLQSKVIVANNSFGSAIEELHWDGAENMDIFYINNEIRTA